MGGVREAANGNRVPLWCDGNVLELGIANDCTTL